MPITDPPLTVTEASDKTGINYRTIQQAILRGRLPAHKTTGKTGAYLIDPADLHEWATRRNERAS